jgi:hypothetical protein
MGQIIAEIKVDSWAGPFQQSKLGLRSLESNQSYIIINDYLCESKEAQREAQRGKQNIKG